MTFYIENQKETEILVDAFINIFVIWKYIILKRKNFNLTKYNFNGNRKPWSLKNSIDKYCKIGTWIYRMIA